MRDTLSTATELLCNSLKVPEMIRKLQSYRVLNDYEVETIQSKPDRPGRVDKLLAILKLKPVQSFLCFMKILGTLHVEQFHTLMEYMKGIH